MLCRCRRQYASRLRSVKILGLPASAIESDVAVPAPIASNATVQGRAINRRIEVEFPTILFRIYPIEPQLCLTMSTNGIQDLRSCLGKHPGYQAENHRLVGSLTTATNLHSRTSWRYRSHQRGCGLLVTPETRDSTAAPRPCTARRHRSFPRRGRVTPAMDILMKDSQAVGRRPVRTRRMLFSPMTS